MTNPPHVSKALTETEQAGLLAEFAALRAEILKRIEFRHQLAAITLAAAGRSSGPPSLLMMEPLLLFCRC